jgi:hypothetical protein
MTECSLKLAGCFLKLIEYSSRSPGDVRSQLCSDYTLKRSIMKRFADKWNNMKQNESKWSKIKPKAKWNINKQTETLSFRFRFGLFAFQFNIEDMREGTEIQKMEKMHKQNETKRNLLFSFWIRICLRFSTILRTCARESRSRRLRKCTNDTGNIMKLKQTKWSSIFTFLIWIVCISVQDLGHARGNWGPEDWENAQTTWETLWN